MVRIDGVNRPIAGLLELLADEGIEIIGRGFKVAAEHRFRWIFQYGEIQLALVTGHQGFVIADQLCRQADDNQNCKKNQTDKTQAVSLETSPRQLRG